MNIKNSPCNKVYPKLKYDIQLNYEHIILPTNIKDKKETSALPTFMQQSPVGYN